MSRLLRSVRLALHPAQTITQYFPGREKMKRKISLWIGLVVFVCLAVVAGAGIAGMRDRNGEQQLAVQKKAIERAAVLCYALEGFYPPKIEYLEEKYGLIVDRNRFFIVYRAFGSNIRPEISAYRFFGNPETMNE